jgi:2-methylcitrate dehydratase PrpD
MKRSQPDNTPRRQLLKAGAAAAVAALTPWRADAQAPDNLAVARPPAASTPGQPALTAPISRYIAESANAVLPDDIRELGKRHILDTIASIVACRDLQPAVLARRYALSMSRGGPVTILGTRERVSLIDAVFASAVTGHSAEINDFSPSAYTQPGPPVLSTALCLGATRHSSGRALLNAVVVGYELTCRIPKTLGVSNLRDRLGLANHGVGPVFGSAASAAAVIGLPADRIPHLLSYCAQQASGSWQWLLDVDHIEKAFVFAGMPARNGLQAALLVEAGFTGVPDCLDTPGGWLMSGMFNGPRSDLNRAYLIEDLGRRFELPLVGYKRYPTGGPAQAGVEGVLQLLKRVDRRAIDRVHIAMPERADAFANASMPALNLPYLCAIIILDGQLDFTAAHSRRRKETDQEVLNLMSRVEVVHDPSQEREPRVESARVSVTLKNGERQEVFIDGVPGFPTHPMTREDIADKALELMAPRLGPAVARQITSRVWALEEVRDVNELVSAMGAGSYSA